MAVLLTGYAVCAYEASRRCVPCLPGTGGSLFLQVYQSSASTTNYFAGKTGVGVEVPSKAHMLHVKGDVLVEGAVETTWTQPSGVRVHRSAIHAFDSASLTVVATGTVTILGSKTSAIAGIALEEAKLPGAEVSYQLTPIGAPMPNLHVATESMGGIPGMFEIGGAVGGKRVSWTLTVVAPRLA